MIVKSICLFAGRQLFDICQYHNQTVRADEGHILSPNFPARYTESARHCTVFYNLLEDEMLNIEILHVDLKQASITGKGDFLRIAKLTDERHIRRLRSDCGEEGIIPSSGTEVFCYRNSNRNPSRFNITGPGRIEVHFRGRTEAEDYNGFHLSFLAQNIGRPTVYRKKRRRRRRPETGRENQASAVIVLQSYSDGQSDGTPCFMFPGPNP